MTHTLHTHMPNAMPTLRKYNSTYTYSATDTVSDMAKAPMTHS